jgi:hypothetical protein
MRSVTVFDSALGSCVDFIKLDDRFENIDIKELINSQLPSVVDGIPVSSNPLTVFDREGRNLFLYLILSDIDLLVSGVTGGKLVLWGVYPCGVVAKIKRSADWLQKCQGLGIPKVLINQLIET